MENIALNYGQDVFIKAVFEGYDTKPRFGRKKSEPSFFVKIESFGQISVVREDIEKAVVPIKPIIGSTRMPNEGDCHPSEGWYWLWCESFYVGESSTGYWQQERTFAISESDSFLPYGALPAVPEAQKGDS